ncbi:MAG: 30S ribosomal protein S11 [Candidatus Paceibacterota bacterium]
MGKKRIITAGDTTPAATSAEGSVSKKTSKRQVINGVANISISYNNTIVSIADSRGEIIAWSSAGSLGFKGSKKSTPYAANLVAKNCVEKAQKFNLMNIKVVVKGIGPGRESAIRGLAGSGLNLTSIQDNTPVAHNGVRKRKPRRV